MLSCANLGRSRCSRPLMEGGPVTESQKAIQEYLARGGKVTRMATDPRNQKTQKEAGILLQLGKGQRND